MDSMALPVPVYLNGHEKEFYSTVAEELEQFLLEKNQKRVLLFPPFPNRLRYLTHRIAETYDGLSSFSVGEGLTRRTVVCHVDIRIPDDGAERNNFSRDAPRFNNYRKHRGGRGGRDGESVPSGGRDGAPSFRASRGRGRRQFDGRPDRALYVPAGARQKYGTWDNDRKVANEPDVVADGAGKESNCDDLIEKRTLENECKENNLPKQDTDRSEEVTNCEATNGSESTLEDKTKVENVDGSQSTLEDITKVENIPGPMDEVVGMETSCKAQEMSRPAMKDQINMTDLSDPVEETAGMAENCKGLDSGKAALEDQSKAAGVSEQMDETERTEMHKALGGCRAALEVEGKVVDIPSALGKAVSTETKCDSAPERTKAAPEDKAHGTISEIVRIEANCKEATIPNQTDLHNVNMSSTMPEPVGDPLGEAESVGLNQTVLKVESRVVDNVADLPEPVCETVAKEGIDNEDMDINQTTSEVESKVVCITDSNQSTLEIESKVSDNHIPGTSEEERSLVDRVETSKEMEKEAISLEHVAVEPTGCHPQVVHGSGMSDSEITTCWHKNTQQCPSESSIELQKTEDHNAENIKCSAQCQNGAAIDDVGIQLPELVNQQRDSVGAAVDPNHAISSSVSEVSMDVLTVNENQESKDDEDSIQHLLQEIKAHLTEKDISIEKLKFDYSGYGVAQFGKLKFTQIIEIYDFVPELNTEDIMEAFAEFQKNEFRLQWVDSTHALGIFSTEEAASQTLEKSHPLLSFRPLSQASKQAKQKAYQCLDVFQPFKERPQTDTTVAKRFLNRALGLPQKRKAGSEEISENEGKLPAETLTCTVPTV